MTAAAVAAAYVLCIWLVALLSATGIWLIFVMVLQSGARAAMQVRAHLVPSYPSSVQTLYAQCTRLAGWDMLDELFCHAQLADHWRFHKASYCILCSINARVEHPQLSCALVDGWLMVIAG